MGNAAVSPLLQGMGSTPAGRCISARLRGCLALFALTLLAACGNVVPRGGDMPSVSSGTPGIPATGVNQHRVALLLPTSGRDGDVGRTIENAARLALTDTKNQTIRLTTYDTAAGADKAAQRAVADGNKLILGPLRGDNVVPVSNYARPAGVPIISFSNDVGVAGRNVFLMGHLPGQSIDRIVRYARSRGVVNFGGIVTRDVYGQRAMSNLASSVRNAGGRLVKVEEISASDASINAATRSLDQAGPIDAVLIAAGGRTALQSMKALDRNGLADVQVLGTDRWNVAGSLANNPAAYGAWFASVADGLYNQYAGKYRAQFGRTPIRLSSLGYDSILLVARASQNWPTNGAFPTATLTDAGGFIGIDGAFRFLPNGLSDRRLEVQEVRSGQFVTIDAAPKSFDQ